MTTRKWSPRLLVRYTLLQLPAVAVFGLLLFLVQGWIHFPAWIFWGAIVLWLVKDAALYPLVWRAYDTESAAHADTMLGARGITKERLAPSGYVYVHGALWKAELIEGNPPIAEGQAIRVRERRRLTLFVEPWKVEGVDTGS